MKSGNGVDIGAVYQLLTEVSGRVTEISGRVTEISGRLDAQERKLDDLTASVTDLRSAVSDYHRTVVGHGVLYSEIEQRVRRIERHLKLEPAAK